MSRAAVLPSRAPLAGVPELVAETDAHEGPVYAADEHALYFTSVRRDTVAIKRLGLARADVSVVRAETRNANGMTLGPDGRLVVCEQGTLLDPARIALLDRTTGSLETLVEGFNSPNDVVVRSDASVWFTDPSYGHLQGFRPVPETSDLVYRFDPRSAELVAVARGFDKPNGLAFSPDERVLYVADNGDPHSLFVFDVEGGRSLRNRRRLAVSTPEHPDGLKTDGAGRIYASFADGIQILAPGGDLLEEIELPGAVNFAFGRGRESDVLYVTRDDSVWAVPLNPKGA